MSKKKRLSKKWNEISGELNEVRGKEGKGRVFQKGR